jgi:hypothetical protein
MSNSSYQISVGEGLIVVELRVDGVIQATLDLTPDQAKSMGATLLKAADLAPDSLVSCSGGLA